MLVHAPLIRLSMRRSDDPISGGKGRWTTSGVRAEVGKTELAMAGHHPVEVGLSVIETLSDSLQDLNHSPTL
jgi:hypothetical protein